MYTGIIHEQAKVSDVRKQRSGNAAVSFTVPVQVRKRLRVDDSVLVDGVCLTITKLSKNSFSADVMPETLKLTTLGNLRKGELVNLELSLQIGDRLGGHFVMGHVDGVGMVKKLEREGSSLRVRIQVSKELMPYIAKKGSIVVNGVSLTVTEVFQNAFGVALIPHTLAKTNLSVLRKGSNVNVEVDLIARIVGQYLKQE